MPWDFSIISHRPRKECDEKTLHRMNARIQQNEAGYWFPYGSIPGLWKMYPEEFFGLREVLDCPSVPMTGLIPILWKLVLQYEGLLEIIIPLCGAIHPVRCGHFVESLPYDVPLTSFQFDTSMEEEKCILLPVLAERLIAYAKKSLAPSLQEVRKILKREDGLDLSKGENVNLRALLRSDDVSFSDPNFFDLCLFLTPRWKESQHINHELHCTVQQALFCLVCEFLGRNGFHAVCDH